MLAQGVNAIKLVCLFMIDKKLSIGDESAQIFTIGDHLTISVDVLIKKHCIWTMKANAN